MFNVQQEIELLERCAQECVLISQLATDPNARAANEHLADDYRRIADELRTFRQAENDDS